MSLLVPLTQLVRVDLGIPGLLPRMALDETGHPRLRAMGGVLVLRRAVTAV